MSWQDYPCIDGPNYGGSVRKWYQKTYRSLPKETWVLHHCDNPNCRQIEHIFLVTNSDNMKDCAAKGRLSSQTEENRQFIRDTFLSEDSIRKLPESMKGLRNNSVLTLDQVRLIRNNPNKTVWEWVKEFNVNYQVISRVKNNQTYIGV